MNMNDVVKKVDEDIAQAELNHVEATQGTTYAMSEADINKWMDN